MDDNSDDGYLPGQSYFINKNYENNEQYEDPENDDNYNNNHYSNNNYGNEINDQNYQEDDYYDDYGYQEENYNNSKNGNDNEIYDNNTNYNEHESSDYNHYNNDNFRYNKNNYYQNNKFHNKGYNYKNNYGSYYYNNNNDYITEKRKESYLASFSVNFILWLTLVIKKSALEKNNIIFTDDKKINKEIVDSFLNYYDIKTTEEKEKTTKKKYFSINIENIKVKKAVEKDYILEFSIIIKDKIDTFFVDKFIEIGVIGNIYYNLYPKFNFCVKKYKLTLDDEKIEDNIILDSDIKKENYEIGMCPDYEINNNKEFKQLFDKISENKQLFDKKSEDKQYFDRKLEEQKMKGPQEVLRECFNNLYKFPDADDDKES